MIKYGIWGCGDHALQSHAFPGERSGSFNLVALHDVNQAAFKRFNEDFSTPGNKVPTYSDQREFLLSGIRAVVIATPDEFHIENLRTAISAGLHVLVEKPLAVRTSDLPELEGLLRETEVRHLIITSCHPRRFDPPFVWLKTNLPRLASELGSVVSFEFDFSYHKPTAAWKHDRSLLLDHFNHEIDLMTFLFGRSGFSARRLDDVFDSYTVAGIRNGISFLFQGTRRLESREFHEWATVRFSRGSVRLSTHKGKALIENHETQEHREENCGATNYELRFLRVMENFAASINGTEGNYLSHWDLLTNTVSGAELAESGTTTIEA